MKQQKRDQMTLRGRGVRALTALRAALGRDGFELRGKAVLITGGSRGLGLVLARKLARKGARLAICARDEEELERAKADLTRRGAVVVALRCDVRDKAQVDAMVSEATLKLGHIDVLINNAGVIQVGPIEVMTIGDYEEAMQTHFWGPLYASLAVLPAMKARGSGRIVNISSFGGKVSVPHLVPYSASKFALVGLSEGMRAELLKDGIVVTTVCPGLMRTGSARNALFKGKHRAEHAWFSIGAALPFTSTSAERAARQILKACRRGKAEIIITPQAKIAAWVHGLMPGFTADLMGFVNKLLPAPEGIGTERAKGKDSKSWLSPSLLTILNDRAAKRNNEIA